MLSLVCLAFTAVASSVSVRWMLTRVDSLGRVRPFPVPSVTISLALALLCAVPVVRHELLERRMARAASTLIGARVEVHCQSLGESWTRVGPEMGWVQWGPDGVPERRTTMSGRACDDLAGWLRSDRDHPTRDQSVAVHVLTHEAMHMAGERTEALAECAAAQRDVRMATLLGARPDQARAVARRYWREVYPRLPEQYTSGECVEGGRLDEGLPDAPWDR